MLRRAWIVALLSSLLIICAGCGGGSTPPPPPPPPPSTVAITFTTPLPTAVAQQTGSGNWTAASLSGSTLMVSVPAGTTQYGVAFVCTFTRAGSLVKSEFVIEADLKDGNSFTLQLCNPSGSPATGNITGNVDATAIPGFADVQVSVNGDGSAAQFGTPTASFNLNSPIGTTDVYATVFNSSNIIVGMKIVRGQPVPGTANGGNPIQLAASDAVTTLQPISLANVPAGFIPPIMFTDYVSAHGAFPVGLAGFPASTEYAVVPVTEAQAGDYYLFEVTTGNANQSVSTTQYLVTPGPLTLTFPPPWAAPAPAPATFPTFTFNYTGLSNQPAISDNPGISWSQGSNFFGITVYATANHQNGAGTVTIPDLTAVAGFFPMAPSGATVTWEAITWGGTVQTFLGTSVIPQTISNASNQGTYVQP